MSIILCTNSSCSRAGWCKRHTYIMTSHGELSHDKYDHHFFILEKDKNCYVPNVSRRIYERENPNDRYDEPEQQEHSDNNREPGLREDNNSGEHAEEGVRQRDTSGQDSVLQLQRSGDRGSDREVLRRTNYTTEQFDEAARHIEQLLRELITGAEESRPTIFPNPTLHGFSSAWTESRRTND